MYAGSNIVSDVAWYTGSGSDKTVGVLHEGGKKQPNELGLYDMSGNVAEWCWDWAGDYPSTAQNNPVGPPMGYGRITRGGSWGPSYKSCMVLSRNERGSASKSSTLGFRVVRNAQ